MRVLQEGEKSFFQVYRAVFEQLVADERDAKSRRQAMKEQMTGDEFEYVSLIRRALALQHHPTNITTSHCSTHITAHCSTHPTNIALHPRTAAH